MPTPLYLNGFENQVFAVGGITADAIWSAITGTASVTSTTHRGAGARSMQTTLPSGSSYQSSMAGDTYASQTRYASRFYFRKSGNPSATVRIFDSALGGSIFYSIDLNSSGQLFLNVTGGTGPVDGSVTAALTNDQWYLVDVVVDGSTTSYVGRLWLDGTVASTDATTTAAGAAANTRCILGVVNSVTISTGRDLFFDDWICGTASGIDDRFGATDGVVALLPDDDGTHSPSPPTAGRFEWADGTDVTWNGSSGNKAFAQINSGDLTQTATRIQQTTAGSSDYCEVTFGTTTLSAAAPVAVSGQVGLNTDGTNAFTAKTSIFNGAAENVIFSGDWSIAAGTKSYKQALVTVANQSELDGLVGRIGYGTSQPAIPYWEGLMLEVDIGLSAGGTPSLIWQPATASLYSR